MKSGDTGRGRNWSKRNLPSDIWAEILSYLPVKTLLRFRSVCKTWKSIIEDPEFASLQLNRCPSNLLGSHLILFETSRGRHPYVRWLLRRSDTFRKTSDIDFPADGGVPRWFEWKVISAINGLLLLQRELGKWNVDDVILWNPSIRKRLCLCPPYPPPTWSCKASCFELCLGFDPSCNDYKVLMIVHHDTTLQPIPRRPSIEIFSLKARSWRSLVDGGETRCVKCTSRKKLSFGGYLYWIGEDYSLGNYPTPERFVSFDLTLERFSYTPLPVDARMKVPIVVDGSSVGLLTHSSIWVLERSPGFDSREASTNWSKRYEIGHLNLPLSRILHLKKDGILLYGGVSSYDHRTAETKVVSRSYKSYSQSADYVDAYVESLVLLKQGME